MFKILNRIVAFSVIFCLVFEQSGFAQVAPQMPIPAYINGYIAPDHFRPVQLRSISFDRAAQDFSLYLDKGDNVGVKPAQLNKESAALKQYFEIGIVLPNKYFWVNLRPDAPDQIIDPHLARTDMGKALLEADLQLKKDMAGFTSPNTKEGRDYWNKLYAKAEQLFGQNDISVPTITRPWIVPGEILVRESESSAYILKATLKVMLEQDYLTDAKYAFDDPRLKELNEYSSDIIRTAILPKLTREVNSSKKYAAMRQAYYSLILAQWFKSQYRGKEGAYSSRIDTKVLDGLTSQKPWSKDTYFTAYKKSFEKGEYNISETVPAAGGLTVRQYFSGGASLSELPIHSMTEGSAAANVVSDHAVRALQANLVQRTIEGNFIDNQRPSRDGGQNMDRDKAEKIIKRTRSIDVGIILLGASMIIAAPVSLILDPMNKIVLAICLFSGGFITSLVGAGGIVTYLFSRQAQRYLIDRISIEEDPDILQKITPVIDKGTEKSRERAVDVLIKRFSALKLYDSRMKEAIVRSLGAIRSDRSLHKLIEIATHDEYDGVLRIAAIRGLKEQGIFTARFALSLRLDSLKSRTTGDYVLEREVLAQAIESLGGPKNTGKDGGSFTLDADTQKAFDILQEKGYKQRDARNMLRSVGSPSKFLLMAEMVPANNGGKDGGTKRGTRVNYKKLNTLLSFDLAPAISILAERNWFRAAQRYQQETPGSIEGAKDGGRERLYAGVMMAYAAGIFTIIGAMYPIFLIAAVMGGISASCFFIAHVSYKRSQSQFSYPRPRQTHIQEKDGGVKAAQPEIKLLTKETSLIFVAAGLSAGIITYLLTGAISAAALSGLMASLPIIYVLGMADYGQKRDQGLEYPAQTSLGQNRLLNKIIQPTNLSLFTGIAALSTIVTFLVQNPLWGMFLISTMYLYGRAVALHFDGSVEKYLKGTSEGRYVYFGLSSLFIVFTGILSLLDNAGRIMFVTLSPVLAGFLADAALGSLYRNQPEVFSPNESQPGQNEATAAARDGGDAVDRDAVKSLIPLRFTNKAFIRGLNDETKRALLFDVIAELLKDAAGARRKLDVNQIWERVGRPGDILVWQGESGEIKDLAVLVSAGDHFRPEPYFIQNDANGDIAETDSGYQISMSKTALFPESIDYIRNRLGLLLLNDEMQSAIRAINDLSRIGDDKIEVFVLDKGHRKLRGEKIRGDYSWTRGLGYQFYVYMSKDIEDPRSLLEYLSGQDFGPLTADIRKIARDMGVSGVIEKDGGVGTASQDWADLLPAQERKALVKFMEDKLAKKFSRSPLMVAYDVYAPGECIDNLPIGILYSMFLSIDNVQAAHRIFAMMPVSKQAELTAYAKRAQAEMTAYTAVQSANMQPMAEAAVSTEAVIGIAAVTSITALLIYALGHGLITTLDDVVKDTAIAFNLDVHNMFLDPYPATDRYSIENHYGILEEGYELASQAMRAMQSVSVIGARADSVVSDDVIFIKSSYDDLRANLLDLNNDPAEHAKTIEALVKSSNKTKAIEILREAHDAAVNFPGRLVYGTGVHAQPASMEEQRAVGSARELVMQTTTALVELGAIQINETELGMTLIDTSKAKYERMEAARMLGLTEEGRKKLGIILVKNQNDLDNYYFKLEAINSLVADAQQAQDMSLVAPEILSGIVASSVFPGDFSTNSQDAFKTRAAITLINNEDPYGIGMQFTENSVLKGYGNGAEMVKALAESKHQEKARTILKQAYKEQVHYLSEEVEPSGIARWDYEQGKGRHADRAKVVLIAMYLDKIGDPQGHEYLATAVTYNPGDWSFLVAAKINAAHWMVQQRYPEGLAYFKELFVNFSSNGSIEGERCAKLVNGAMDALENGRSGDGQALVEEIRSMKENTVAQQTEVSSMSDDAIGSENSFFKILKYPGAAFNEFMNIGSNMFGAQAADIRDDVTQVGDRPGPGFRNFWMNSWHWEAEDGLKAAEAVKLWGHAKDHSNDTYIILDLYNSGFGYVQVQITDDKHVPAPDVYNRSNIDEYQQFVPVEQPYGMNWDRIPVHPGRQTLRIPLSDFYELDKSRLNTIVVHHGKQAGRRDLNVKNIDVAIASWDFTDKAPELKDRFEDWMGGLWETGRYYFTVMQSYSPFAASAATVEVTEDFLLANPDAKVVDMTIEEAGRLVVVHNHQDGYDKLRSVMMDFSMTPAVHDQAVNYLVKSANKTQAIDILREARENALKGPGGRGAKLLVARTTIGLFELGAMNYDEDKTAAVVIDTSISDSDRISAMQLLGQTDSGRKRLGTILARNQDTMANYYLRLEATTILLETARSTSDMSLVAPEVLSGLLSGTYTYSGMSPYDVFLFQCSVLDALMKQGDPTGDGIKFAEGAMFAESGSALSSRALVIQALGQAGDNEAAVDLLNRTYSKYSPSLKEEPVFDDNRWGATLRDTFLHKRESAVLAAMYLDKAGHPNGKEYLVDSVTYTADIAYVMSAKITAAGWMVEQGYPQGMDYFRALLLTPINTGSQPRDRILSLRVEALKQLEHARDRAAAQQLIEEAAAYMQAAQEASAQEKAEFNRNALIIAQRIGDLRQETVLVETVIQDPAVPAAMRIEALQALFGRHSSADVVLKAMAAGKDFNQDEQRKLIKELESSSEGVRILNAMFDDPQLSEQLKLIAAAELPASQKSKSADAYLRSVFTNESIDMSARAAALESYKWSKNKDSLVLIQLTKDQNAPEELRRQATEIIEFWRSGKDGGMNMLKLKNGSEEAEPLVKAVMLSLNSLLSTGRMDYALAFYELVMKARDPQHMMFSNVQTKILKDLSLMQGDGTIHDSIRNIVLSSAIGDDLNMSLQSPIAEKKDGGDDISKDMTAPVEGKTEQAVPEQAPPATTGGVDFRALPVVSQPAVMPAALQQVIANAPVLSAEQMDNSWEEIEKLMAKGQMPYSQLKQFAACCHTQAIDSKHRKMATECVLNLLKLEEERALATSDELKEIVVLL